MNKSEISSIILEKAPLILDEIKKSSSVLLHCHPSPDPDSVGSALAMKFALEQMGKKATIILGDAKVLSPGFVHFPGSSDIVIKSFNEIDVKDFDLFIILDSGSPDRISFKNVPIFPLPIRTINIDHHKSNTNFADINLVDISTSTTFILSHLFKLWNLKITKEIALNLFIGMYTDSGGFKYYPIDYKTFEIAGELTKVAPDFTDMIFKMENSNTKDSVYFEALALNSIETFLNNNIAIASISYEDIEKKDIHLELIHSDIPNQLKSVIGWNIGMTITEIQPDDIKISMRSRDVDKFDVSGLAVALGGGGHRAAAGIRMKNTTIEQAKVKIVSKAKELYNL